MFVGATSNLSGTCLISLAESCPLLEIFCLENNKDINQFKDSELQAVFIQCKNLKEVGLFRCSFVTDQTIHQLVTNCKGLKKLTLLFCDGITDASMHYLLKESSELNTFIITSSKLEETAVLHELARKCESAHISVVRMVLQTPNEGEKAKIEQLKVLKTASSPELKIESTEYDAKSGETLFE